MPMATAESSNDQIQSLPLIDLRLLSQSELYTLSLSAATHLHRRSDDDSVIPKIDRSVFNESAGSRKQTFSRLRLAPRNKQNSSVPASSSFHIPLRIPEPVDEENSQIIALLQQLFGVESLRNAKRHDDDDRLVPVQVEFKQPSPESAVFPYQNIPIDVVNSDQRKRKRGRPRKKENSETLLEEEPRKVDEDGDGDGKAVAMVNERGFVADAVRLADSGDPFGEELKRRTQGLETESQLLEFLESLNGEWGSQRKKRRIIQASYLGDLLPTGWKIVLCLMRRAGRASVVCRRYVSPDGHQFESYKEVSEYLLSFFGVQDISHLKSNYTDGSQKFSSNINMASESQSVGRVPTGDMKTDANSSLCLASTSMNSHDEKQATISSSIGSEKLNTADGNLNSDLALGFKLGDTTSGAFGDLDHQTEDKQPLNAERNDANSVQGHSLAEDRVCNVSNENFVGAIEASDGACNLYIPLVFTTPFPYNNSGICQFSDERNAVTCIKSGMSNFAGQDRNNGCFGTAPCGNEQAHLDNNGLGISQRFLEEHIHKKGFESSMPAPNSEGKIFAGNNLEDRHLISSLKDMEMDDGKPVEDEKQKIISSRDQSEIKDISTNVKLQSSSEGCSLVPSQNELKYTSINSTDRTKTSMLKDSAVGTCILSGSINNVSSSACTQDASESGGVDVAPNLKVAKDVCDNHIPPNVEVVTSYLQERNSSNDQNCKIDNLLHISSESNLLTPTGNQC
ncbi:uncharacterized protein LOC133291657 [Gastrolobium bilobum]|uniref:uncharacterized protein LOC133291657 n=1 Tax=Gastrolobium bilobum TaxID=150636 RepID=UPI002AAFB94C|nr:uncharacterized protein LOC133291657 [Gastrolobium bilobum]